MQCKKCNGATNPKQTKVGTVYECISGCKDPKKPQYALGTWPPKEQQTTQPQSQPTATAELAILQAIYVEAKECKALLCAINSKTGTTKKAKKVVEEAPQIDEEDEDEDTTPF